LDIAQHFTYPDMPKSKHNRNTFLGFEIQELQVKRWDALINYFKMDMVNPPKGIKWGKVNDHMVKPGWVTELVKSFREYFDHNTDMTTMNTMVRKGWINNLDQKLDRDKVDWNTIDQLAPIKLTDCKVWGLARLAWEHSSTTMLQDLNCPEHP
jgi:hypothetical protein